MKDPPPMRCASTLLAVAVLCATSDAIEPAPRATVWRPLPADGVISSPGSYFLTGDLKTSRAIGLKIDADNVVVDLRSHALRHQGAPKAGIYGVVASKQSNLEIRNGSIGGFWFNTHLQQIQGLTISRIRFDDIAYIGANVANSRDVQITRCHFSGYRFRFPKSKDKYLIGVNLGARDAVVTRNRFNARAPVTDSKPHDDETVFVLLTSSSRRCLVGLNEMVSARPLPKSYGVWVASKSQATVADNRIHNMRYAIALAQNAEADVIRNRFSANAAVDFRAYGVYAKTARHVSILHNLFESIDDALLLPEKGAVARYNKMSKETAAGPR